MKSDTDIILCQGNLLDMMLVGGRQLFAVNYHIKGELTAYNHPLIRIFSSNIGGGS